MRYKVNVGINWTPDGQSVERRAEPGDMIEDLSVEAAGWMVPQGIVEPVEASTGVTNGPQLPSG